jgi:hypothetical protein
MRVVVVGSNAGVPSPAPVAIIRPTDADPFVLAASFVEHGALYASADPRRLCVFERFDDAILIDTTNPSDQKSVSTHAVGVFAALDEQLLLVHDEVSVTAIGAAGVAWQSAPIVTDDLHIRRADNGRIVCRGWNYKLSSTQPVEVTLDAATGAVLPVR